MKITVDLSAIVAVFAILYCNAGVTGFIKGSVFVTLFAYGAVLLWFILAMRNDGKMFQKFLKVSFPIICFLGFLMLVSVFASGLVLRATTQLTKNLLFLLVFIAMQIYYCVPHRRKGRRFILGCWFIDIAISCGYTIYRLIENPMLSRILAVGESRNEYLDASVSTAGVLGYGSIYGLVFLLFALVCVVKNTKRRKITLVLFMLLFAYTVIQAQFFIAFCLMLIGLCIAILGEQKTLYIVLAVLCILTGIFFVWNALPQIISSGILPPMISNRLQIFLEQSAESAIAGGRIKVYIQSIEAIGKSFGLGAVFFDNITPGGHSEIMDLIAYYGIFFGSLFIYGVQCARKNILQCIPAYSKKNYNIVWLMYLLMSFLNPSAMCNLTLSIFIIIPLIYLEFGPMSLEDQAI